ncbi:MAG TPA: type II secretion system F family protein [Acidimicrobiales bacterium]|nr:type II secretion system F family protein [Acidimicrobiales bacterium]
MTIVLLAGLGTGLALIGLWRAARPSRGSAHGVVRAMELASVASRDASRLRASGGPSAMATPQPAPKDRRQSPFEVHRRVGELVADALDDRFRHSGPDTLFSEISGWLRVTGTSLSEVCGEVVLAAFAGLALPIVFQMVAGAGGVRVPATFLLPAAPLAGTAFGLAPVLALRNRASQARKSARFVLASFLDLVVLGLAGGMGIEGALHSAARVSDDAMSLRLRESLEIARDSGETPWRALAALGSELGIDELAELAAAVGLAGREGARVRSTLAAKAGSIRRHQLAEAESEANTLTERLFFPGAFLLVGFLLFLGYPAVSRILGGF